MVAVEAAQRHLFTETGGQEQKAVRSLSFAPGIQVQTGGLAVRACSRLFPEHYLLLCSPGWPWSQDPQVQALDAGIPGKHRYTQSEHIIL